ncbi:MAG: NAD(+) synthase, partial [Methylococcaceae bacterium]|nr:NAD(+) synthase [Methylococcaceae bacterium]
MNKHGFVRLSCISPKVHIANPKANIAEMQTALAEHQDSDIVLFPELSITGYTCGDLFNHDVLLDEAELCLLEFAKQVGEQLVLVGLPLRAGNALYNCGVALNQGRIIGAFPKQFLPNYGEFYEARWFRAANGNEPKMIALAGETVPFGIDLLFKYQGNHVAACPVVVSGVICEDDWMPISPAAFQSLAGATVQCNLSASNETIGKHQYRLNTLVIGQSGRHLSACAYASAGASESTTDLVFGGHMAIAENGSLLADSRRVGDGLDYDNDGYAISADIDVKSLLAERHRMGSYADCSGRHHNQHEYRYLDFSLSESQAERELINKVTGSPFVPKNKSELEARCAEVFGIQVAGLTKRLQQLGDNPHIWVGISGGLDSTLAALAALKAFDAMGLPRSNLHGLTMPGFGTSDLTKGNADEFMQLTGMSQHEESICQLALDAFKTQNHKAFGIIEPDCSLAEFKRALAELTPEQRDKGDLVFENVQARLRTFLLMSHGFVLGTGDLSELALGWCTYNADHMSMYNVNCSIPKTLVSWLVRYVAEHEYEGHLREVLMSIADTTISPELLPVAADGSIAQATEDTLGAYELHDFFLYHMQRKGHAPEKILYLAQNAEFNKSYSPAQISETLELFYKRFFSQQYKRSCVPDGPKVGSVS